jgi:four helix bundle protein
MNDMAEALRERTMRFAIDIMRFCRSLPEGWEHQHVRHQLFRAGTSVASNYRSTCRARSRRDFIAKLGIVVEESDESVFWLDFLERAEMAKGRNGAALRQEARELLAIFTQSAKTASSRPTNRQSN